MDSVSITLSTGETVTVGPLRWAGYKRVRDVLLVDLIPAALKLLQPALASTQVSALLQQFLGDGKSGSLDLEGVGQALGELQGAVQDLAWQLTHSSDALSEALVEFATTPPTKLEALSFVDAARLRSAVLERNPLPDLVALEKNWLAALGTTGRALLGIDLSSSPAGTSPGNPFSSAGTAGDPPMWTG